MGCIYRIYAMIKLGGGAPCNNGLFVTHHRQLPREESFRTDTHSCVHLWYYVF